LPDENGFYFRLMRALDQLMRALVRLYYVIGHLVEDFLLVGHHRHRYGCHDSVCDGYYCRRHLDYLIYSVNPAQLPRGKNFFSLNTMLHNKILSRRDE
jgi:hypothetical protein